MIIMSDKITPRTILLNIERHPDIHEPKKASTEEITYRAEDCIYESNKRQKITTESGHEVLEPRGMTISRVIDKYFIHEEDAELRALAETLLASETAHDLANLSRGGNLDRNVRRNLARSTAGFNHRIGSLIEQIGDRVPFTKVIEWLGKYNNDVRWAENLVNGAAAELGVADVLSKSLSGVRIEPGHVEQDIDGGDIILHVKNENGFEEIIAIDVKCYKDPLPDEIFVDMDNKPNGKTGKIPGERPIPVVIDSHGAVLEEQFARRVRIAIPPESIKQRSDGSIMIEPKIMTEQLEGIRTICDEVAQRTRNSTRRKPKRPRI